MPIENETEIAALLRLSARIGCDPLLAQASSGNTSVKVDGVLWIKASGRWLAHATRKESLIPLDLAEVRRWVQQNVEFTGSCTSPLGNPLRASIETAMHAVLPHRVVIHVHSVNTIAWAVRQDGCERLTERLAGMRWRWIPYVPSGLPLAQAVETAMAYTSDTNVFILGNHGLVICGEDCDTAETLLSEVESRLAISARRGPECHSALLAEIAGFSQWRLPETGELHALATDAISRKILNGGILYPCQAVFLGATTPLLPNSVPFPVAMERFERDYGSPPFWIVEGRGVVRGHALVYCVSKAKSSGFALANDKALHCRRGRARHFRWTRELFDFERQCRMIGWMEQTDEELYRQMRKGNRQAFAALYERRGPALYRYALHMSGSWTVAEEVAHEVFVRLMGPHLHFDERRGTLEAYLSGVARNLIRVIRRKGNTLETVDRAVEHDILGDLIKDETAAALYTALDELPDRYRDAVVLCDLEERSYEDAGRIMGCPLGTVRSRLHRARLLLAAKLRQVHVSLEAAG